MVTAVAELAINRLAVPALRPLPGKVAVTPPTWFVAFDYVGLFLFYFTTTLAIGLLGRHVVRLARAASAPGAASVGARLARGLWAAVLVPLLVLVIAATVLSPGRGLTMALQISFLAAAAAAMTMSPVRFDGASIGLRLLVLPPAIATVAALVVLSGRPDQPPPDVGRHLVFATSLVAMLTPYCFAPRPFQRAILRLTPILAAMLVAAGAAVAARFDYPRAADLARRATGVELLVTRPDPQLAMFILALATVTWTVVACLRAPTAPRRAVGVGIALIAIAGVSLAWPMMFALIIVGLLTITAAIPHLREAEAGTDVQVRTPSVEDAPWQGYVAGVVDGLREAGHQASAVTARGEADQVSTIVAGRIHGRPLRLRIERIGGAVVVIDARIGRDVDDARPATFTLAAHADDRRGEHPEPPPAAPAFRLGEAGFDERFRLRGDRRALLELTDEGHRARLAATATGWLASWNGEAVRHRIYPGRGAPIDHPIPLSELALRKGSADGADRLVAMVCLLGEVATRIVPGDDDDAPRGPGADDDRTGLDPDAVTTAREPA
jgi:hypothetical protein